MGIDAPDFNLGVEKWLKERGLRTVHYVSPSVWAWREKRAEKIGQSADLVLCLFPMEPPIYARHDVDARFVGHPLADAMPLEPDRAEIGRAHVRTPVTNAHLVCRLLLEKKKTQRTITQPKNRQQIIQKERYQRSPTKNEQ